MSKLVKGRASYHKTLLQYTWQVRIKEKAQAVPATIEWSVASPAWQLGGVELQGRALVANPANAQKHSVSAHLTWSRCGGKQAKWLRQCRAEEWTCAVSRRLGGRRMV